MVNATVNIYASDGILIHTTSSDSSARYKANFQVEPRQYPLTVEVIGGIDLVTGREPDFDLVSVVTGPDASPVVNVNSFTTVATQVARSMKGGLSRANVEAANAVVLEKLNFGLDTTLVPSPFYTDVNKDNAAVLIRANEALGEMLRRSHQNLSGNGLSSSMDTTLQLLVDDLADGELNGDGVVDKRIVEAFLQVSSQVLDETMLNALRVDGVVAAAALDDSILVLQPDTSLTRLTDSVPVNPEMLVQAEAVRVSLEQGTPDVVATTPTNVEPTPVLDTPPASIPNPNADTSPSTVSGQGSVTSPVPVNQPAIDPVVVAVPVNTAPVLSGSPKRNLTAGEVYDFQPVASDDDGDVLSFTIASLPAWASFNRKTGRLTGTPTINDVGVANGVVITVSDGELTSSIGPFTIRVNDPAGVAVPQQRKYHPGHYLALYGYENQSAMYDGAHPGVRGINKRYTWQSLEPTLGQYDFSQIESDLAVAASQGLQLVVMVEDKSFKNDPPPTPEYLWGEQYTRPTRTGGYTAVRYNPYVIQRFKALLEALGQRFDSDSNLEGIALQETALGFVQSALDATGYTPEKYRDALIDVVLSAADSFPTSQVFWYMNFLSGKQAYLADVAAAVAPAGVRMGGPDILPDDHSLQTHVYPLYDQFQGKMPLFCSAQNNSYQHEHADTSYPTRYWTPNEIFKFASDRLGVGYVFWNHNKRASSADSYSWYDALPVIEANPVFNQ